MTTDQRRREQLAEKDGRIADLEKRLAAAEQVAYLYGICGSREHTGEREEALHEAWRQWWDHPGVPHEVRDWTNLTDRDIEMLALADRSHHEYYRSKLEQLVETVPAGEGD